MGAVFGFTVSVTGAVTAFGCTVNVKLVGPNCVSVEGSVTVLPVGCPSTV